MHEASTPLSVYSAILSYHKGGWFIDLSGNYYDRIYLSYAPGLRNGNTLRTMGTSLGGMDADGNYTPYAQSEGHGGFMLDASIGKESLSPSWKSVNQLNDYQLTEQSEDCKWWL